MQAVHLEIPQDIVLSLKMPSQTVQQQLLEKLALSLYAEGYLSFGKARKLCKLSKWEFVEQLGKHEILRHYTEDDLDEDLAFADENI